MNNPSVAVMGAGAVGCYYGAMLARAGVPVTLIGRANHVSAIQTDGLAVDSFRFQERIPMQASTDVAAVCGAAIVLLCVKTLDTETAAQAVLPHLAPGARLLSLQNGVDNIGRIRAATGMEAIPAVVYVAAEMTGPGQLKHSGRGDLIVANEHPDLAQFFEQAGIPCPLSPDILVELWKKMLMNCAYNAISALGRSRYGRMVGHAEVRETMRRLVEEAVAVARAEGVKLPEADYVEAAWRLSDTMGNAISSTAQDLARGKATEVDSLNGYIVRRGAALGVDTPVNQTVHAVVKLLEETVRLN
jgi:2-dehydropantoate 2-reductase